MDRIDTEAKWYVIHTFSGYENIAKENLETVRDNFNWHDRIFDIVIPTEDVIEEDKNGKKKLVTKKLFPSYILIKMIYGDDLWHVITGTRGVTGFTGPNGRALALTEDEIKRMRLEHVECSTDLSVGDKIEVIDGPLVSLIGTIEAIDIQAKRVKAKVEMFGRETSVDLENNQIRKI